MFLINVYGGIQKVKEIKPQKINRFPFVAVIVPFRNEEENLPRLIESLKNQTYPKSHLQIILVDDNSDDNSYKVAEKLIDENFLLLKNKSTGERAFKKKAIEYAMQFAQAEIIVTTDADCLHDKDWLLDLISYFDEKTGVVSGPVVFIGENTLFEKMQKLEFAGLVLTGAGLIGAGNPVISNAANFAYRKKAFDVVDGYSDNKNLTSGDDEILMQKIATETDYKIKFAFDKKTIVKTEPKKNISEFFEQRKRWASKSLFYFNKSLILLLFFIFLFYLSLIYLLFAPLWGISIKWFFYLFILKSITEFLVVKQGAGFLFEKSLLKYFLLTEILQIPYILFSSIAGVFGNYEWKGRKIKR